MSSLFSIIFLGLFSVATLDVSVSDSAENRPLPNYNVDRIESKIKICDYDPVGNYRCETTVYNDGLDCLATWYGGNWYYSGDDC